MSQAGGKTGRERVMAAYKGEFADCVPAYPIAGSFAGCLDGLSIEEYCTNPTKAVKAMINYYERYQPDIMVAFNDHSGPGFASPVVAPPITASSPIKIA